MESKAVQKFVRTSPSKLRLVVSIINKLTPTRAVEVLPHVGKKAAEPLGKTIQSAIANAKNKGISETDLVFKEIQINDGPSLKRGRAVGHGRWHPYKKKMSHIRVVLTTKEPKVISEARDKVEEKSKSESKSEKVKANKEEKKSNKSKT